jgi:ribose 5-phosphate isomerase A
MTAEDQKKKAALAAIDLIPRSEAVIGVGTGSTVNYFIDALPTIKSRIKALVSSSKATTARLQALHLPVDDPNQFLQLDLYVDGADEFDPHFQLIKGGGGAMTGERIIASMAKKFICIVDESKAVKCLGQFPVAVEVLQPARSAVARKILALGGDAVYREGFLSDWGNPILDVYNLKINDARMWEKEFSQMLGVVGHGLFASCLPQIILEARKSGTITHTRAF